jgi:UDP-N-acetylglucosamine acyltransferase
MIHPTAVIDGKAQVDGSATVGPHVVIEGGVEIGPDCVIGPHCHFTGRSTVGAGNRFHAGCVIGDAPQDLKYGGEPTALKIGDQNVFREYVTVNRSNTPEERTVLGSRNYLMANAHVGHNSVVGDQVIIANGTSLGGHVTVQDQAFLSANCLVHQFCRVGELSLMQGFAAVSKDLPPFTIARGINGICGLNIIGLRRAGITPEQRLQLKRTYRVLFRSGLRLEDALTEAGLQEPGSPSARLVEFVSAAARGLCAAEHRSFSNTDGK